MKTQSATGACSPRSNGTSARPRGTGARGWMRSLSWTPESRAIEHVDGAAVVLDQPAALEAAGGHGDAGAAHAEHVGENFMSAAPVRRDGVLSMPRGPRGVDGR